MQRRILIVDDEPVQRRLMETLVARFGHAPATAQDGEAALAMLAAEPASIDLIILDLVMPGLDGMNVLKRLREEGYEQPVIVATARGGVDTVVAAMQAGAADFIVKPARPERVQVAIQNALKLTALAGEVGRVHRTVAGTLDFADIITRSAAMAPVLALARKAAAADIPVMIEGESGVGKELIARAIQGTGPRRAKPFVTVNCGAIPETLVESTLFGHEKGAFTGAIERHVGRFQEADTGTLFLDEVGELTPDIQVKLLRALQDGEIDPVGGRRAVRVDFRLISATNRALADLVRSGDMRDDLYYRLNVFPIRVPPLRERREDIAPLAQHFAARFAAETGRRLDGIRPDALAMLQRLDWPGNIRQLQNAVHRAVILAEGPQLAPPDFPQLAAAAPATTSATAQVGRTAPPPDAAASGPGAESDAGPARDALDALAAAWAEDAVPAAAGGAMPGWGPGFAGGSTLAPLGADGHIRSLAELEEVAIRMAIERYNGRMTEVARRLGIGRSTLYRKLKEYGLDGAGRVAAE